MSPREAWLSGAVEGVTPLLQPASHALLQAREEVRVIVWDFPTELLWERPAGLASPGFHLQHLSGVVDRLLTYARGESLTPAQQGALAAEGTPPMPPLSARALGLVFDAQVEAALIQLRATRAEELTETRAVGRAGIPSTVIGLVFHAAEHSMRHVGQLLVTTRLLTAARD